MLRMNEKKEDSEIRRTFALEETSPANVVWKQVALRSAKLGLENNFAGRMGGWADGQTDSERWCIIGALLLGARI